MNLRDLIRLLEPLEVVGPAEAEIASLACDSRLAGPGSVFFALEGVAADGHDFIDRALASGTLAVVGQQIRRVEGGTYLRVADSRLALARAANAFYGRPCERLSVVGVTGTSGKTSTTYALESILISAGKKTGVIGTVDYRFGGRALPAPTTTPESLDLARLMADWAGQGAEAVVMEVSSHALIQHRVAGCAFDAAAFTNLSRDHLDYHADMEDYFQAKRLLFTSGLVRGRSLIGVDDPYGRRLKQELGPAALTFGLDHPADVSAPEFELDGRGIKATLVLPQGRINLVSPLIGRINLLNLLAAAGLAHILGISPEIIETGLNRLPVVPGRLENVGQPFGRRVIVDYSHKVEALACALETVRDLTPGRIITVFGCGGDRDKGKRPMMARAAAQGSEVVVVTSDNPRTEDPASIIDMILPGFEGTGFELSRNGRGGDAGEHGLYTIELDRRSAIRKAVAMASAKDTVVICGKGHEDYQIIGREKIHLDDREEARAALAAQISGGGNAV